MGADKNDLRRFTVAIPASVTSDTPHLREKTAKLGSIARACSIFGVNEIIIYSDNGKLSHGEDAKFSADILEYLDTPQYLRKRLFKLNPEFRFAGILPPLQVPHHNVPREKSSLRVGDVREGVVVSRAGQRLMIDAGFEEQFSAVGDRRVGDRVTLRITSVGRSIEAEVVEAPKAGVVEGSYSQYWGYRVARERSLGKLLKGSWELKIGTSRYGDSVQNALPSLSKALKTSRSMLVVFGAPKKGLIEILSAEGLCPKDVFHYFLNTAPGQQTLTVRTEEALLISLGILNVAQKFDF